MKRGVIAALITFVVALLLCWYGGVDFSQRGAINALLLMECALAALAAYFFAYKDAP